MLTRSGLDRRKRGGDFSELAWVEDNSLVRALDHGHIRLRHLRRGEAGGRVHTIPNFTIVSFTHGGLTAWMRKFRGKTSRPALTIEMDERDFGACYWNFTPTWVTYASPSPK